MEAKIQSRSRLSTGRAAQSRVVTRAIRHGERLPESKQHSNAGNWAAIGAALGLVLWLCYHVAASAGR